MDKEEFIDILIKRGYKAVYESNMPIVIAKDREDLARIVREVKNLVNSTGFHYSWGVSVRNIETDTKDN